MKKILGMLGIIVTGLTAVTLFIDTPTKIYDTVRSIFFQNKHIRFGSMTFLNEGIWFSKFENVDSKNTKIFVWPSYFVIHNTGSENYTITNLYNEFDETPYESLGRKFAFRYVGNLSGLEIFKSKKSISKKIDGVQVDLPFSIKPGEKIYVKKDVQYGIFDNGVRLSFSSDQKASLGIAMAVGAKIRSKTNFNCHLEHINTVLVVEGVGILSVCPRTFG